MTTDINVNSFGSRQYLSPELTALLSSDISEHLMILADIWALGVSLFVMAAGYKPWDTATVSDPNYSIFLQDPTNIYPAWFSPSLCNLLGKMLQHNWEQRLSLTEIAKHDWYAYLHI